MFDDASLIQAKPTMHAWVNPRRTWCVFLCDSWWFVIIPPASIYIAFYTPQDIEYVFSKDECKVKSYVATVMKYTQLCFWVKFVYTSSNIPMMYFISIEEVLKSSIWANEARVSYFPFLYYQTHPFGWYMARLVVENGHRKDMTCYKEIGLCTQFIDISPNKTWNNGKRVHNKKITFTLISYNFCILTLALKLEMIIMTIGSDL